MKKIILVLAVCLLGFTATFAQNKAIGLRGGYGFEVTYQQPLGDANRLEADLGMQFGGVNLAALPQFINGCGVWNQSDCPKVSNGMPDPVPTFSLA